MVLKCYVPYCKSGYAYGARDGFDIIYIIIIICITLFIWYTRCTVTVLPLSIYYYAMVKRVKRTRQNYNNVIFNVHLDCVHAYYVIGNRYKDRHCKIM